MAQPGGPRLSAQEVAALTGGRLVGPADVAVAAVASLEHAGPGELAFLAGSRQLPYFRRSAASLVLCRAEHETEPLGPRSRVVVGDPQAALLAVLPVLYPAPDPTPGVHPSATIGTGARWEEPVAIGPGAVVGAGARLGRNVRIGAGAVIGDGVTIGDDTLLHARVVCYPGTAIGRRVILHAGVVL
ncbi:MAG: LpxD N-terminal domain-containing protein, partial [Acidimicrobiales bacterium]